MDKLIQIQDYDSPYGQLILGSFQEKLVICDWKHRKMRLAIDRRIQTELGSTYQFSNSSLIHSAIEQLEEYFNGSRIEFNIPVRFCGTEFQKSVWQALLLIPYGKTTSYLQLSENLNNPKAIRAVASANGANALSIIVPCHRIIGTDGKLVGYAGGFRAKQKLLSLENKAGNTEQLSLFS